MFIISFVNAIFVVVVLILSRLSMDVLPTKKRSHVFPLMGMTLKSVLHK